MVVKPKLAAVNSKYSNRGWEIDSSIKGGGGLYLPPLFACEQGWVSYVCERCVRDTQADRKKTPDFKWHNLLQATAFSQSQLPGLPWGDDTIMRTSNENQPLDIQKVLLEVCRVLLAGLHPYMGAQNAQTNMHYLVSEHAWLNMHLSKLVTTGVWCSTSSHFL